MHLKSVWVLAVLLVTALATAVSAGSALADKNVTVTSKSADVDSPADQHTFKGDSGQSFTLYEDVHGNIAIDAWQTQGEEDLQIRVEARFIHHHVVYQGNPPQGSLVEDLFIDPGGWVTVCANGDHVYPSKTWPAGVLSNHEPDVYYDFVGTYRTRLDVGWVWQDQPNYFYAAGYHEQPWRIQAVLP